MEIISFYNRKYSWIAAESLSTDRSVSRILRSRNVWTLINNRKKLTELLILFRSSFLFTKSFHFLKQNSLFLVTDFNWKSVKAFIRFFCSSSVFVPIVEKLRPKLFLKWDGIPLFLPFYRTYLYSKVTYFFRFYDFILSSLLLLRMSYGLITHKIYEKIASKFRCYKVENCTRELKYVYPI